jgi:hypothetical protein
MSKLRAALRDIFHSSLIKSRHVNVLQERIFVSPLQWSWEFASRLRWVSEGDLSKSFFISALMFPHVKGKPIYDNWENISGNKVRGIFFTADNLQRVNTNFVSFFNFVMGVIWSNGVSILVLTKTSFSRFVHSFMAQQNCGNTLPQCSYVKSCYFLHASK